MKRDLIDYDSQQVLGSVSFENGKLTWEGRGPDPFEALRQREKERTLGLRLMEDGWSNGYLYLGDPQ